MDVTETAGSDTVTTMCFEGKDLVRHMRADPEAHPGEMAELALNVDRALLLDPGTEEHLR